MSISNIKTQIGTNLANLVTDGVFEVIITTEDTDRMGEVIQLDGWDLKNYMKNPVVLWGHDHYKMPIGICTSIERTATGLLARGKFAPGEEGQEVRQLYDLGIVRATSVGFIEKAYRDWETDRKSTRLNSSHSGESRMPSSA